MRERPEGAVLPGEPSHSSAGSGAADSLVQIL